MSDNDSVADRVASEINAICNIYRSVGEAMFDEVRQRLALRIVEVLESDNAAKDHQFAAVIGELQKLQPPGSPPPGDSAILAAWIRQSVAESLAAKDRRIGELEAELTALRAAAEAFLPPSTELARLQKWDADDAVEIGLPRKNGRAVYTVKVGDLLKLTAALKPAESERAAVVAKLNAIPTEDVQALVIEPPAEWLEEPSWDDFSPPAESKGPNA